MKPEITGSLVYDLKSDSYKFEVIIPCSDHDRVPFKCKAEEVSYYKRKAERLFKAFAESDALEGEFVVQFIPSNSRQHQTDHTDN